jgi:ADP-heptose:LPS heptosyltransferase
VLVDRAVFRHRYNYAAAVASEIAAPLFRLWARRFTSTPAAPPAAWRRAVILGSSHIGDVLFRTASLPYLRRALPDCRLTYLCAPLSAELLETDPTIAEVLPLADTGPHWRGKATRVLRDGRFDVALCTDYVAYHDDLLMAARAGIPSRVGFTHKGFSALVTRAVVAPRDVPSAAYMRAFVADLGGLEPTWDLTPRLVTTTGDDALADQAWRELGLGQAAVTIACTVTSRQAGTATWPVASYIAALADVARGADVEVVLCGSAADAPILRAAAAGAPFRCRVAAGRLSLRALAAFLRRCRLLLATDSGPRHIANAVGTPVVFVRNLKVSRIETGVYCANESDVAPDDERLGLARQRAVLTALRPATVADAVRRRLADPR